MGKYEKLLIKNEHLDISETSFLPCFQNGMYIDGQIFIKQNLKNYHKHEILSEELAHHEITYGNITDQSNILNRKYELKARRLACENVISLQGLIDAFEFGVQNLHEMAIFFEVSKSFVQDCLEHYKKKYGLMVQYKNYDINFEPLTIYKKF